jgi:hypothetical protein
LLDLYTRVVDTPGVEQHVLSHATIAPAVVDPILIEELSKRLLDKSPIHLPYLSTHPKHKALVPLIGLETGSVRLAKQIMPSKGVPFPIDEWPSVVVRGLEVLNRHNWFPAMTLIVGSPGETDNDCRATLDLIYEVERRGLFAFFIPSIFTPLHDTRMEHTRGVAETRELTPLQWQLMMFRTRQRWRRDRSILERLEDRRHDRPREGPGQAIERVLIPRQERVGIVGDRARSHVVFVSDLERGIRPNHAVCRDLLELHGCDDDDGVARDLVLRRERDRLHDYIDNTHGENGVGTLRHRQNAVPALALKLHANGLGHRPIDVRHDGLVLELRNPDGDDAGWQRIATAGQGVAARRRQNSGTDNDGGQSETEHHPHHPCFGRTTMLTSLPWGTTTLTISMPTKCGAIAAASSAA